MRDLLKKYDSSKINLASLATLITNLEALLDLLNDVDEKWKQAFRGRWGVLDDEYAVALDREQTSLTTDGIERISRAVDDMQALLEKQLRVMSELYETVRRAVHFDWDPIGVSDLTDQMGEYDSYVPGLCDLLGKNASEKEVFDYLWTVETESIGLQGNREATERFASWLCNLTTPKGQ
ncbi:MAG: hypothetical protein Tsb009_40000 [Planctomycetaceae bacterium]